MTLHDYIAARADRHCPICWGLGWIGKHIAARPQKWEPDKPIEPSVPAEWIEEVCRCLPK